MKTGVSQAVFTRLCEVISSHMGLAFHVGRHATVIRNLALAAEKFGFSDFNEFIQWLLIADLKKVQVEMLASYLTISETFFWREPHVFSALTDFILPEIMASKTNGDRTIRIWSAGCSSGEEPYSLAIALQRTIPDIKDWDIRILATDINPEVLKKAVTGIYTKWSFRNCPSWLQTGYFHNLGNDKFEISPRIRQMVTFRNLNLSEDIFPSFTNDTYSMDIIFCRNVLMYFTEEWVSKISRNLFKSLNSDGWFVVASCELSSFVFPQFKPVNFKDAILYRKGNKAIATNEVFVSAVAKKNSLTKELSGFRNHSTKGEESNPFIIEADHVSILESINEKQSPNVHHLEYAQTSETKVIVDPISEIRVLADMGLLKEALSLCNESIAIDKLSIDLYSIRASILQELDRHDEAIVSLKQAIYLDHNFIMGHFVLGNLFIKQGKQNNARIHFKNVLDLIKDLEEDKIIPGSDGLSVQHINAIVKNNLQNHKMI